MSFALVFAFVFASISSRISSRRFSPWSAAPPVRPEAATFVDDPERSDPDPSPSPDPSPRAGAARLSGPPVPPLDANLSIATASLLVAETERFVRLAKFSSRRARLVVFVLARGNSDASSGFHASSSSRLHPRAARPPSEPARPAISPDADGSLSLSLL